MTYQQALEYTHSLLKFGIRPGLGRMSLLLEQLGNPQDTLKVVHVAGTNGKGSTCAMLSSIFHQAGYKTGLFISPYVVDFRERVQIDGQMIPEGDFAALVGRLAPLAEQMAGAGESPTEFEFITAAALLYFAEQGCGAVVLETGLGGRLDSTNVVKQPLVSVITSISMDHTDILGDTIEQIAAEKAGIIKPGGLCVTCHDQDERALPVLLAAAAEQGATLCMPAAGGVRVLEEGLYGTRLQMGEEALHIPFCGRHQISNALLAAEAARLAGTRGLAVSREAVAKGIANAVMPARMELVCQKPPVLLDGMHNEGGALALKGVLEQNFSGQKLTAVMGMLRDKNYERVVRILAPLFESVITVTPDNPRAFPAEELAECVKPHCADVTAAALDDALLPLALRKAGSNPLIVFGSFYLASALRPKLLQFAKKAKN